MGVAAFARDHVLHGDDAYAGPFDRYRDIERDQGLTASFQGRGIDVPVPYMMGDRDTAQAMRGVPEPVEALPGIVPRPRAGTVLPGRGHWTRQEHPRRSTPHCRTFLAHLKEDG